MNIMFDDQAPIANSTRVMRTQKKGLSMPQIVMMLGMTDNPEEATKIGMGLSFGVIIVCCVLMVFLWSGNDVDEKYYYDPTRTGNDIQNF